MDTISRDELKQAIDQNGDLRVIEVLAPEQFKEWHLPGAENVPLSESFEERIQQAVPNRSERVVVYCADTDCPASAKAAQKMEALGYENVSDYVEGKADWKDAGLPTES